MSDRLKVSIRSNSKMTFMILITATIAAGLSQGLLLPILSILLEQKGVSSSLNGLNAAALYIGSFGMTLIAERVLGAVGFKKLIAGGISLVLVSLLMFPFFTGIKVWFVLRLLVGVGDAAINYGGSFGFCS